MATCSNWCLQGVGPSTELFKSLIHEGKIEDDATSFRHAAASAVGKVLCSLCDLLASFFQAGAPIKGQSGSQTPARCESCLLDIDQLARRRGHASLHDV